MSNNILLKNRVKHQTLEGIVRKHYAYLKSNKFTYSFTTSKSEEAIKKWGLTGSKFELNNYVPKSLVPATVPISEFTIEFENGTKEQFSVGKHLQIKEEDEIILKYFSVDKQVYYLFQIENKSANITECLITQEEAERFVKLITSIHLSILTGLLFVCISCLFMNPYLAGFIGFVIYFATKKMILLHNVRLIKSIVLSM